MPPEQTEIQGFEQKRIPSIERQAAKFDEKRNVINGLDGELENIALKLREAMHENKDAIDHQESPDGEMLLIYKRGDYNIVVKRGKEKVNVKVGEDSKGAMPDEATGKS